MLDSFKRALQLGVKDASADVRKAARHLFWVLKSITVYEGKMDRLLDQFDASTKKHIKQELQNASEDFIELLNNPTGGLDDAPTEYTHITPFEAKQASASGTRETYTAEHSQTSLSSSQERPFSDPSRRAGGKSSTHPPPLPAQSHTQLPPPPSQSQAQAQSQTRQPSGPSRVLHSAHSTVGRKTTNSSTHPSSDTSTSLNGNFNAFSAPVSSSTEFEDQLLDGGPQQHMTDPDPKERSIKSAMGGGSRRTSMAPERVIRQKPTSYGTINTKPMRQSEDSSLPVSVSVDDSPLSGPPALPISNSIRNKR